MLKEALKYRLNTYGWLLYIVILVASFDINDLSGFFIGLFGFPLFAFMGAFYQEGQRPEYTKGYKDEQEKLAKEKAINDAKPRVLEEDSIDW